MTTVAKNTPTLVMPVSEEEINPPVKAIRKKREYKKKVVPDTNSVVAEQASVSVVPKISKKQVENTNTNIVENNVSNNVAPPIEKVRKPREKKNTQVANEVVANEVAANGVVANEVVANDVVAKDVVPEVQKKIMKKKSGAKKEAGAKHALEMREKGKGIFAPKKLSPQLAAICGKETMARTDTVKCIWSYIKEHKLNEGRLIRPDSKLFLVFPKKEFDMMEIPKMLFSHLS